MLKSNSNYSIIQSISNQLSNAVYSKTTCNEVHNLLPEQLQNDLETAYSIQNLFVNDLCTNYNTSVSGRKAGCTNIKAQKLFNINEPLSGFLIDNFEEKCNQTLSLEAFINPAIEVEVAFILKKSITQFSSLSKIVQAVDYVVPAFEIIDRRIIKNVNAFDLASENLMFRSFVLGHSFKKLHQVNLNSFKVQLFNADKEVREGTGINCLGSPINALHWLANQMIKQNKPLLSGETVITGALADPFPIPENSQFKAVIENIGEVAVNFQ